jgi:hypothetical protein
LNYTLQTFLLWLFSWFPGWLNQNRGWVEKSSPALYFWMLTQSHHLTYGMGRPPAIQTVKIEPPSVPETKPKQTRRPSQPMASAAGNSALSQPDSSSS